MKVTACDDRGRILLSQDVREAYGERFYLIRAARELILIPVPKDPLKAMREEWAKSGLGPVPIKELRKRALENAGREAKNGLRGH